MSSTLFTRNYNWQSRDYFYLQRFSVQIICWTLHFYCSLIDWSVSFLTASKQSMKNILARFPLVSLNVCNVPWRMVKGLFGYSKYTYIELWEGPPMQSFLLSFAVVDRKHAWNKIFHRKGKEGEGQALSSLASLRKLSFQSWCVLFFYRI